MGAPVVLVTDVLGGGLGDRVAVVVASGRGTPGLVASHATTIVVLEALAVALAGRRRSQAVRSLERFTELRDEVAAVAAPAGRQRQDLR